ncbi:11948_t:CDS:2, partial [Dentiscutata erythropus]
METLQNADTIIIVGDGKNIYANSQILKQKSQYFNSVLSESWARKKNDFYIIKKPNAKKESMNNVLQYLYFRKPYNSQGVKKFINTFSLADEMYISDAYLVMLRQYFDTKIEILLKNDLLLILGFIENYNNMQETVVKTILNKPKLFFSADKFQNIPIQHLKLVISKNNLNLKELQILNKVILWLYNNQDECNEILKYVRFDQITYEELSGFNCDNKGATIVIRKLKNEGSFIGGYNPLDWSIDDYYYNVSDGRVKSFSDTIYCKKNYGSSFGRSELFIQNNQNCWSYEHYHYYESIGLKKGIYELDLFEAFQINSDGGLRAKTKTLDKKPTDVSQLPEWNFDGSSTNQAPGDNSDVLLRPVAIFKDPFRGGDNILVLNKCYNNDRTPNTTNYCHSCAKIMKTYTDAHPWFGIKQEYTLFDMENNVLSWPKGGFPGPQGPYYCFVSTNVAFGHDIVEAHYRACLYAGQCEFKVGPCEGIDMGNWNGAGCYTNFLTQAMSEEGGIKAIYKAIDKMSKIHAKHIAVYGEGNDQHLTGHHETGHISQFFFGVANRSASICIPCHVAVEEKGYLEDRRPASNIDLYCVTHIIVEFTLPKSNNG